MSDSPSFAAVEPTTHAAWRALVEAGLKGASFERRTSRTLPGGVVLPVLATAADAVDSGLPGQAPYTRGTASRPGWRTALCHPSTAPELGTRLAQDAAQGATACWLEAPRDPAADHEEAEEDDLAFPDGIDLFFGPGVLDLDGGGALLDAALWEGRSQVCLGVDPATLAAQTASPLALDEATELALAASANPAEDLDLRVLLVDTGYAHDAGADDVLDLALALSTTVAWLRELTGRGLSLHDALAQQVHHLRVGTAPFAGIAKLRAFRSLLARVCEASGDVDASRALLLVSSLGSRHLSRVDAPVNVLRNTSACFAAALGGAQVVASRPHDALGDQPGEAGRRIARNTPLMLDLESGLADVADPIGGSWSIEQLTADLASAAWTRFQELEAQGGLAAVLASGWLADQVDASWTGQQRALRRRKAQLTGVSAFASLGEAPVRLEPTDGPFPLRRWAAGFETLRARADAWEAAHGAPPGVLVATLGPEARHTARTTWVRNALAAGGFHAEEIDGHALPATLPTPLAVLSAPDDLVAAEGAEVVTSLVAAGARHVRIAGRPGAQAEAHTAAGAAGWLGVGDDLEALLAGLHDVLAHEVSP